MVFNFSEQNTVVNSILAELRDVRRQNDRTRFRRNVEHIGELLAYEISKTLNYAPKEVETPFGSSVMQVPTDEIVIAGVLRAGLPLHYGLLKIFDQAESAFVSTYRNHIEDGEFEVNLEYVTSPGIAGKVLILADPMLATGSTIQHTLEALEEYGHPSSIHIATLIACHQGINGVQRLHPSVHIWAAAIDDELTAKSYIVPGLGDAGDLCFGKKQVEE